jgi:hypothetical protein
MLQEVILNAEIDKQKVFNTNIMYPGKYNDLRSYKRRCEILFNKKTIKSFL